MSEKKYIFWFGTIRYYGNIISETNTHWVVNDIKGVIELPKANTTRQEVKE